MSIRSSDFFHKTDFISIGVTILVAILVISISVITTPMFMDPIKILLVTLE